MIARAAEWNPSVFSPKGKVNIYEIVDKYLDYAIQYDQPFILSKYKDCGSEKNKANTYKSRARQR